MADFDATMNASPSDIENYYVSFEEEQEHDCSHSCYNYVYILSHAELAFHKVE